MPFIEDEELLEFHKAIDFNKNMAVSIEYNLEY